MSESNINEWPSQPPLLTRQRAVSTPESSIAADLLTEHDAVINALKEAKDKLERLKAENPDVEASYWQSCHEAIHQAYADYSFGEGGAASANILIATCQQRASLPPELETKADVLPAAELEEKTVTTSATPASAFVWSLDSYASTAADEKSAEYKTM